MTVRPHIHMCLCILDKVLHIEAVHLFLQCIVFCVANIVRYLLNQTHTWPTSNLRLKNPPQSPKPDFLFLTSYSPPTNARVSPSAGSLPVPRSTSLHHRCPGRAPTKTARRLFDLTLFPISLPSLHLNPSRNRHPTVTLRRTSRILAAIMSTRLCHHALINGIQG